MPSDGRDDERRLITRRRLLGAAVGTVGVVATGGLYVASELRGDDGDYTAPGSFPMVSTRNRFDENGDPVGDREDGDYDLVGEWSPGDADVVVLFVHGLNAEEPDAPDQAYTAGVALEAAGPDPFVAGYSWDSDRDWEVARSIADDNGPRLATWLADWRDDGGRPVHVLAHSLGARVTCEALRVLAERDRTDAVASASLLGGAIDDDRVHTDGRYGEAIETAAGRLANYHNRTDRVLDWLYGLGGSGTAVGESGIANPERAPGNYVDVDVSDVVPDHYSYYEPGEGCLSTVAERF